MIEIGICSYSFHRTIESGRGDIFSFIEHCRDLGCTQLDPWNRHLIEISRNDAAANPRLSAEEEAYLDRVEEAADASGLPWGTMAVDGAQIYDSDPQARNANRARAYRWLAVAEKLGCAQVRIDAGGPDKIPDDVFRIIAEGYSDLIARGRHMGIEILTENHLGPTVFPDNIVRLCENIEGLGLLYDTNNWLPELLQEGRRRCAKYARATHLKTLKWDEQGNEVSADIPGAVRLLREAGYSGAWGIESVSEEGDEYVACERSVALVKRLVTG